MELRVSDSRKASIVIRDAFKHYFVGAVDDELLAKKTPELKVV